MELIILTDGLYQLIPVGKEMFKDLTIVEKVILTCFDLCDILRLKLTTYSELLNANVMNDGSGNMYGCTCK